MRQGGKKAKRKRKEQLGKKEKKNTKMKSNTVESHIDIQRYI